MGEFIIYPAIDLRYGKVVRLKQGKGDEQTVYANDPLSVAQGFVEQGAVWLHLVNLNGAFGEATQENEMAIQAIVEATHNRVKIQLGGGLRSMEQINTALALGVSRVIVGTAVIENPSLGNELLNIFGAEKIAFGLDALGKDLMIHGWQSSSGKKIYELAHALAEAGAETLVYTNIQKDGMQTGVDWQKAQHLANETALRVIAAGGVNSLEDVLKVRSAGLAGVIIGRALYEGIFTLEEVLHVR